ncbi:MAG: BMC domain-containing protein [Blautia faecis]
MSYGALGLVEVLGSCNAVVVLDQMLKTSDVEFRTWHTKCGGHATVFKQYVAAVKAAVDAVKENPPCEIVAAAVISAPSEETSRLVEEEEEKHHK